MNNNLNDNMERFYKSFISVMHFFYHLAIEVSRAADLSLAQFRVLMVLQHFGSMSVNELRSKLNIAQSSASEIIERLVRQKMLAKEKNPEDKRMTLLRLTPRAKKFIWSQQDQIKNQYRMMLSALDEKDQTILVESFENIQKIVDKYRFVK